MVNGYKASVWEDEKVLKSDGSDGYKANVNVLDAMNCIPEKWLQWQISYFFFTTMKTFH